MYAIKRKSVISSIMDMYVGEPCVPYSIYRYKWVDGNLDKCEYQVYGRKMNFDYLHHKLFIKHKPYMRLTSKNVISKLSSEELSQRVSKFEAPESNDHQYLNTGANERMFNSVKVVADQCSNRHPDNVVMKVLLHVQSKQIENSLIGSEGPLKNQDNRVSKESNFLPCYKGSVIPDNYIESRKSSFQAHLFQLLDTRTWCMVGERQWYSCVQRW